MSSVVLISQEVSFCRCPEGLLITQPEELISRGQEGDGNNTELGVEKACSCPDVNLYVILARSVLSLNLLFLACQMGVSDHVGVPGDDLDRPIETGGILVLSLRSMRSAVIH